MRDVFGNCHPVVNFTYFSAVILFAIFLLHPACLLTSLASSCAYYVMLKGARGARRAAAFMLPALLIAALVNPAFNHAGATILTYLPSGNPLTLESILVGAAAAVMLVAVIAWFACLSEVFTADKFVYLFGRIIPALSLVLAMALRFIPRFQVQARTVVNAQKCLGRDLGSGSIIQRARLGVTVLSIMITWALENAIETADSMRSRGYGLKGRTAFAIFTWDLRDRVLITLIAVGTAFIAGGALLGKLGCQYLPLFRLAAAGPLQYTLLAAYLALCTLPLAIYFWEDRKWKHTQLRT